MRRWAARLSVGERIEFVNQPFVMDPAQAVPDSTLELAGVVADNDRVGAENHALLDAAPQGAFGGDPHGIGMDFQSRNAAEPVQMRRSRPPDRRTGSIGMLALSRSMTGPARSERARI